ncbi:MAG: hypothetical protein NVSMB52_18840 [Chloroflexota bacterium]
MSESSQKSPVRPKLPPVPPALIGLLILVAVGLAIAFIVVANSVVTP